MYDIHGLLNNVVS